MEKLEGPKIIGKIDLSAFKKPEQKPAFHPEKFLSKLENILALQSREVNEEFGEFLDEEAKIKMFGPRLEADQKEIDEIEGYFARDHQQDLGAWRESKKNHPATVAEMAVTSLLHKFLSQDFIVARASDYDDYKNGVDTVLIDKKTGAVICGFDEVLGSIGDNGGEQKEGKLAKKMKAGGSRLKYGATVKGGLLERKEFANLPTFYLSLSREELMLLLEDLNKDNPTGEEYERKMFEKFLLLLKGQINHDRELDLVPELRENLDLIEKTISQINF